MPPPPLPALASTVAWASLDAQSNALTPTVFGLEAAVLQLQDLEGSRVQMAEASGIYEANSADFRQMDHQPDVPQERIQTTTQRMLLSMRRLGGFRDETHRKALQAFAVLERLPQYIRAEDLKALREILDADDSTPAYGRITSYLAPLRNALEKGRSTMEAELSRRLEVLQNLVAGSRSVAGLPAVRLAARPLLPAAIPSWARSFEIHIEKDDDCVEVVPSDLDAKGEFHTKDRHLELSFRFGGYWIRDIGAPSIGVDVNGTRIKPGVFVRISGDVGVKLGAGDVGAFRLVLPEPPIFESLRLNIVAAESIGDLVERLRRELDANRYPEETAVVDRLESYHVLGTPLGELPVEGGLRARVQELLLEERYRSVREEFAPGANAWIARRRLVELAREVHEAATAEDLAAALQYSSLPGVADLAKRVEELFHSKGGRDFSILPEAFGIRSKAEALALSGAKVTQTAIDAMRAMGLDPMMLLERPWAKREPSKRLAEEFEKLKDLAGGKLNFDRLEETLRDWASRHERIDLGGIPYDGRFVLSVNPKYADKIGALVTATAVDNVYYQSSSSSVFFRVKDQMAVLRAIQNICDEHPIFFTEGSPPFMISIQNEEGEDLPGVGFEEVLPKSRVAAMLQAVSLARLFAERQPATWQGLLQMVDYFLQRSGVSAEEPALSPGGSKKFEPLLQYSIHRPELQVSAEETEMLKELGLNPALALNRRPWQATEVTWPLREAFAAFFAVAGGKLDLDGLEEALDEWLASSGSYLRKDLTGSNEKSVGEWTYAGELNPKEPFDTRVAMSLREDRLEASRKYFSEEFRWSLNSYGISIQVRLPRDESRAEEGESAVYFHGEAVEKVSQFLLETVASHPEYFRGGWFPFHVPVVDRNHGDAPCLSIGEEPSEEGETFASVRVSAMKKGLRLARVLQTRGETFDRPALESLFAFFLERSGIDPQNPAYFKKP